MHDWPGPRVEGLSEGREDEDNVVIGVVGSPLERCAIQLVDGVDVLEDEADIRLSAEVEDDRIGDGFDGIVIAVGIDVERELYDTVSNSNLP